ncbi:hypothetical protein GBF38_007638 [Nibea albiflora]|uniref:Uncharacterized protein n=1 Tax=Nibea albiflora TaxID=240163 RepID=A0ACB7ELZ1_NIBAL|nr:hypothetical protein GBF38_007638 [Nibea albiflora]
MQLTEQVSHEEMCGWRGVFQVTPQCPFEVLSPAPLLLPGLHNRHLTPTHQTAFQVEIGPLQDARHCTARHRTARQGRQLSPAGSALRSVLLSLSDSVSSHEEHRNQDCATMPRDITEEAAPSSAENLQVCVDYSRSRTPADGFLRSRP